MAWACADLPRTCQCGLEFTVSHALSCQLGGFPTLRHDETRDLLADVMTKACNSVAVEPILAPVHGWQNFPTALDHDGQERQSRHCCGWSMGQYRFDQAFFDVCVFNAFAQSNTASSLSSTYCLLYTSPSPRDLSTSRMPSSA